MKIMCFAAVEQCRAAGGRPDWRAIAATVPGRSAEAVHAQYYKLHPAPARQRPMSASSRCRRPWDLGSKAELALQPVQRTDRCDRRSICSGDLAGTVSAVALSRAAASPTISHFTRSKGPLTPLPGDVGAATARDGKVVRQHLDRHRGHHGAGKVSTPRAEAAAFRTDQFSTRSVGRPGHPGRQRDGESASGPAYPSPAGVCFLRGQLEGGGACDSGGLRGIYAASTVWRSATGTGQTVGPAGRQGGQVITNLRTDRDHWRRQATLLLTDESDEPEPPPRRGWWPWASAPIGPLPALGRLPRRPQHQRQAQRGRCIALGPARQVMVGRAPMGPARPSGRAEGGPRRGLTRSGARPRPRGFLVPDNVDAMN